MKLVFYSLFISLVYSTLKRVLLFDDIYQGSCSLTQKNDDRMFNYQTLGSTDLTYVSKVTVAFWMNLVSDIPTMPTYAIDEWSFPFFLTLYPLSNDRLFSAAFKQSPNLNLELSTYHTTQGPNVVYTLDNNYLDVWIFVEVSYDFEKQEYSLRIFDTIGLVLEELFDCSGVVTNCGEGVYDRPYLRNTDLKLFAGSHAPPTMKTFCGKLSLMQFYPNMTQVDNLNYAMFGAVRSDWYLSYLMATDKIIWDQSGNGKHIMVEGAEFDFGQQSMIIKDTELEIELASFSSNKFISDFYNQFNTGRFTISMWVLLSSQVISFVPLRQITQSGDLIFEILLTWNQQKLVFNILVLGGIDQYYPDLDITASKWHNIILSFYTKDVDQANTQYMDIYLDGVGITQENTYLDKIVAFNGLFQIGDKIATLISPGGIVNLHKIEFFEAAAVIEDSDIKKCHLGLQNGRNYHCLYCQPGFNLDYQNQCTTQCEPVHEDLPTCKRDCIAECAQCSDQPYHCTECPPTRQLNLEMQTCDCIEGFQKFCQESQLPYNFETGTFYTFGKTNVINIGTGQRIMKLEVPFKRKFMDYPQVIVSTIYLDMVDDYMYQIEAINPKTTSFTLRVTVRGNTIIKNLGVQYLAFINSPTVPLIRIGFILVDDDTDLATGSGLREFTQIVDFLEVSKGVPHAYSYIAGAELFAGTMLNLKVSTVDVLENQFKMVVQANTDSQFSKILVGWIVVSNIFESFWQQWNGLKIGVTPLDTVEGWVRSDWSYHQFAVQQKDLNGIFVFPTKIVVSDGLSYELSMELSDDLKLNIQSFSLSKINEFELSGISFQMQCQSQNCKLCDSSPYDCLSCLDPSKTPESGCFECAKYYYQSGMSCLPCEHYCMSCETASDNCLTCDNDHFRIDKFQDKCPCQIGYFDSGNRECYPCLNKCYECIVTEDNCTECAGSNRNTDCTCPDKFYDDLTSSDCQMCTSPCDNCHINGCLTCKGNRYIDGVECLCPNDGEAIDKSNFCHSCKDVLLSIRLSKELTVIDVEFSQRMEFLSGDNYDKSEEELCSVLFDDLSVIGVGSLCRFDEDRLILSIELGDSPTFLKEDPLNFKGGVLRAYYCVQQMENLMENKIEYPDVLLAPKMEIEYPMSSITTCDDAEIKIVKYINNGNREFDELEWQLVSTHTDTDFNNYLQQKIDDANNLGTKIINLTHDNLLPNQLIKIVIRAVNFVKQESFTTVSIQIYGFSKPTISIVQNDPIQISIRSPIQLTAVFSIQTCNPSDNSYSSSYEDVELRWYESSLDRYPLISKPLIESAILSQPESNTQEHSITIPEQSGQALTTYVMVVEIFYPKGAPEQLTGRDQISIFITQLPMIAYIQGGDRLVQISKELKLLAQIWDPNLNYSYNEANYTILWECHHNDSQILKEELSFFSFELLLPEYSLLPNEVYMFNMTAITELDVSISRQTYIYTSELNVPFLDIEYAGGILQRKINPYEDLKFDFKLPIGVVPDKAFYSMNEIEDGEIKKTKQLHYPKFIYRPTPPYKPVILQLSINYDASLMPAYIRIPLEFNPPPTDGNVEITPSTGKAMQTEFTLALKGAKDENQPLLFKFILYISEELYEKDLRFGVQSYAIEISPKLIENKYKTVLPKGNLLILGMAIDALGAYTNFTAKVQVSDGESYVSVLDKLALEDGIPLQLKLMHLAAIVDYSQGVPTQLALEQLSNLTHSEKKAVFALKASGLYFKSKANLEAKLEYVEEMQNQFRKEVESLLLQISAAQQAINRDLGTEYNEVESYKGYFGYMVDFLVGEFQAFDEDLGRLKNDIPADMMEEEEDSYDLFDFFDFGLSNDENENEEDENSQDQRRILQRKKKRVLTDDEQKLSQLQFEKLHILYKRILNLIHLMNYVSDEFIETNENPFIYETNLYRSYHRRVTASFVGEYIEYSGSNESVVNGKTYKKPTQVAFTDNWMNIEDLTVSQQNEIIEAMMLDEGHDEIVIEQGDNLLMWENRDTFNKLPKEMLLDSSKLYLISVLNVDVNPYYWNKNIYSYEKEDSKKDGYNYLSLQLTQFDRTGKDIITNLYNHKMSLQFDGENNDTKCVTIVTNFTEQGCLKQFDNGKTKCVCDYTTDILLLKKYVPKKDEMLYEYFTIENIDKFLLGQIILIITFVFLFFILVGFVLDIKQSRIKPISQNNQEFDEEDEDKKNIGDKTIDQSYDDVDIIKGFQKNKVIPDDEKFSSAAFSGTSKKKQRKDNSMQDDEKLSSIVALSDSPFKMKRQQVKKENIMRVSKTSGYQTSSQFSDIRDDDEEDDGEVQLVDIGLQYDPVHEDNQDLGLKSVSGKMLILGIIKLHELFSIFVYFDPVTSRFVRSTCLYMKLMAMLAVSSISFKKINDIVWIILTIFLGELTLLFIKVLKATLSGSALQKILGILLTIVCIGGCWIVMITKAEGLHRELCDEWANKFLFSYLINTFALDPFMVIMKIKRYPWIQQQVQFKKDVSATLYFAYFLINSAAIRQFYQL